MDTITIGKDTYYAWERFLIVSGLKNRKSIYDWVKSEKVKVKKIGSCSFYKLS